MSVIKIFNFNKHVCKKGRKPLIYPIIIDKRTKKLRYSTENSIKLNPYKIDEVNDKINSDIFYYKKPSRGNDGLLIYQYKNILYYSTINDFITSIELIIDESVSWFEFVSEKVEEKLIPFEIMMLIEL